MTRPSTVGRRFRWTGGGRGGWQGRAGGKGAPVEEAYRVLYALADGAHFVAPGTPLFDEALRRGLWLAASAPLWMPQLAQ